MHKFQVVPSTYHQCIKYSWKNAQGTIITDNNLFQTVDAYFTNATYYQKTDSQEITRDTSGKDKDSNIKLRKLKVRHGIKATKDKPTLLLNSITQNFILPLACMLGAWVNPYRASSIFFPKGHIWSKDRSSPIPERELKDPDSLLPHMKLAPQLLYNSSLEQQGK